MPWRREDIDGTVRDLLDAKDYSGQREQGDCLGHLDADADNPTLRLRARQQIGLIDRADAFTLGSIDKRIACCRSSRRMSAIYRKQRGQAPSKQTGDLVMSASDCAKCNALRIAASSWEAATAKPQAALRVYGQIRQADVKIQVSTPGRDG